MTRGGVNGNEELLVTDSPGIKIRNKRDSKKKKKKVHPLLPTNPCESARFSSRDFFPPMKMNFQKKWSAKYTFRIPTILRTLVDRWRPRRGMRFSLRGARFSKGEDICRYVRLRATSPRDELQRDRGREISVKLCPG